MLQDISSTRHEQILKGPSVITSSFNSNALDLRGGLVGAALKATIGDTTGLTATNTVTVKAQKAPLTATGAVPVNADFVDCLASELAEGRNAVLLDAADEDFAVIKHTYIGGTGITPVFIRHAVVVSGAVTAAVCVNGVTVPGEKPKAQLAGQVGQVIS